LSEINIYLQLASVNISGTSYNDIPIEGKLSHDVFDYKPATFLGLSVGQ